MPEKSFRLFKWVDVIKDDPQSMSLVRVYPDTYIWEVVLTGSMEIHANGYGDIYDSDAPFPIVSIDDYIRYLGLDGLYVEIDPSEYARYFIE